MTARLVRYTGPRRAHVGAIGEAATGGVIIGGRVVPGTFESVAWRLSLNGETVSTGTWLDGLSCLPGVRLDVEPCAAGIEVAVDGDVWRLEPE